VATDARIAVGLPQHPKTKKLIKRLGQASAWNLVCLILWAAANRSDGNLSGMSVEDIELSADWSGADGALVDALVAVRFLDEVDGAFMLHDWHEHNPWAAGADMRSAKARWNAAKRHHGAAEADRLVPEYAATRNAGSNASSTNAAEDKQDRSNAPSPSPSPSPIPTYPSSLRSEGLTDAPAAQTPPPPPPKPEKPKREQTTLTAYLDACKEAKSKPIPDGHSVRTWATDAGLAPEMLQIAWLQFRERYTESEKGKGKRYKDWPGHFATAVKANWFKLWFAGDNGMQWTSVGMTHKAVLDARMAQKEVEHA